MDHFESIVKTLLEAEGFWIRQSFKVNLSKEEKKAIGKPSMPRPEIDLLAFKFSENTITAYEAKSFLDSPDVMLAHLNAETDAPEGRYKLFTCKKYRSLVLNRLKKNLLETGMANKSTQIKLGLKDQGQ